MAKEGSPMCTYKTEWEASKNNSNSGSRSRDHLGRFSLRYSEKRAFHLPEGDARDDMRVIEFAREIIMDET